MDESLARQALDALRSIAAPEYCLWGIDLCMTRSEWAAWCQTLGTIGAIAASFAIVSWQVRKQHALELEASDRARLESELRAVEAVVAVAYDGMGRMQATSDLFDKPNSAFERFNLTNAAEVLRMIERALRAHDPRAMTNPRLTLAVMTTHKTFDDVAGHLESLLSKHPVEDDDREITQKTIDSGISFVMGDLTFLEARECELRRSLGLETSEQQQKSLQRAASATHMERQWIAQKAAKPQP